MSTYYPIKNLEDVLMKFRRELNEALQPINERLTRLEQAVFEGKGISNAPTGIERTGEYKRGPVKVPDSGLDPAYMRDLTIQLRYVNIALRGYGQLLTELGLPKDARMTYRYLENLVMMVLRLIQFIRIMQMLTTAGTALHVLGPIGYAIAGGFLVSTVMYGYKTTGGF